MNFNKESAKVCSIVLATILLLLSACSSKNDVPKVISSSEPAPEIFTISTCENVFNGFLTGEIPKTDLVYLSTEKKIALRETNIIINQSNDSSFCVMANFKDLVANKNYNLRYELFTAANELFSSESFTFSSDTSEFTTWITEKLNPSDRKNISTGTWTIKIYINNTLLETKNISILSTTPGQDIDLKEYKWKDYQFQYPGYCAIEEDRDIVDESGKKFRFVKLLVSSKNRIALFLYFADDWTPPSDDTAQQSPALANMMLGLPIALKHAEPTGPDAIALSVGSIELIDGFELATRFIIIKPDSENFSSLECFHRSLPDKMFFGILFTQGVKGKGSDTPEYFRYIQDTYSIIRSISTPELISAAKESAQ
jgi:hypothetical protein